MRRLLFRQKQENQKDVLVESFDTKDSEVIHGYNFPNTRLKKLGYVGKNNAVS